MIDARAAILHLRAIIGRDGFGDMATIRRLALRATSGIVDKALAGELQDRLMHEVEYMAMLAEMNDAAGTPAVGRSRIFEAFRPSSALPVLRQPSRKPVYHRGHLSTD